MTSRGRSERELVQNLNGDGKLALKDGAIVGIDIAAMVRNAADAFLHPEAGEPRKTDFAELGGTFKIRQGILTNDDMHLQAPVLRVDGRGQVDLPKRTIDYRIEPKAAKTLEGQGSKQQGAGLLVPVTIRGPWDAPKIAPDLSGVLESALKNPEAVKKQLDQLDDQAKDLKRTLKDATKQKGGTDALVESLGKSAGRRSEGGRGGKTTPRSRKRSRRSRSRSC